MLGPFFRPGVQRFAAATRPPAQCACVGI